MCFSAEVSFGAGAVITAIGVASLKKVETTPQKVFACIPILFALQQFIEGALWITLKDQSGSELNSWLSHSYLFFAWVIWPTYIPFSMQQLESNVMRRKILAVFLVVGLAVSIFHIYELVVHHVHAKIEEYHILYEMDFERAYPLVLGVCYFISIVLSLFVSATKRMMYLGIMVLATFLFTVSFYRHDHQISVWCFFAGVTSLMILWVLHGISSEEIRHQSNHQA